MGPGRRHSQLVFAALAAVAAAYVAVSVLASEPGALRDAFRTYVHSGLMVAAAIVALRTAWTSRDERGAWWAMALGIAAFAAGEIAWRALYLNDPDPPIPSWADAGWLLTYPAFYVGTMLLVRARLAALTASAWLDGLIALVVALALGYHLYFTPLLRVAEGDHVGVAVTMAYPIGDLLLSALTLGVLALAGGRVSRPWLLLCLGQVLVAVGDGFFAVGTAQGTYVEGRWPDTLWPIGVLMIAWAGRLPAVRSSRDALAGWRAFAVPAVLGAAAIAAEVVADLSGAARGMQLLTLAAIGLVVLRTLLTVRENVALIGHVRHQAMTDELTGLPNRRRLLADLAHAVGDRRTPRALTLLDLDGFKAYNDGFGHAAGDELLVRLGAALDRVVAGHGRAYRLGGDEFCLLAKAPDGSGAALVDAARTALGEAGGGVGVTASAGTVVVPVEANEASVALRLADERMYRSKASSRASAARQSGEVLLGLVDEREPHLRRRLDEVAAWAEAVALGLGLTTAEAGDVRRAAELHDIGKAAIPDAILAKRGPLTAAEDAFVRRHPLIGERILRRAPALKRAAELVRWSHERVDGRGYPDGLAGEAIPIGARIVAVCDAFCAMTAGDDGARARADALAELRRAAGTRFDERVVALFCAAAGRAPAGVTPAGA